MYQVYVQIDAQNRIIKVNSSAFLTDLTDWIQVDEGEGDRFHHAQNNYLPKRPERGSGIILYKLVPLEVGDAAPYPKVVERTAEEIAADIAAIPPPPPTQDAVMKDLVALLIQQGVIYHV